MKLRKFLVALLTCSMVIGMMAISSSAALYTGKGQGDGANENGGNYEIDLTALGIDGAAIDKVVVELTFTSGIGNGTIGWNDLNGSWMNQGQINVAGTQNEAETVTWEAADIGGIKDGLQVQLWWINPMYDENGTISGAGEATINSVKYYDKDGKELTGGAAEEPAEESEEPAEESEAPATDDTPKTGDNSNMMAVLMVLVAAGGVLVTTNVLRRRNENC